MEWILPPDPGVESLAILAGTFHPVTRAHLALAEAARSRVPQVLFTLPRRFPHKQYDQVSLPQRLEILRAALAPHPDFRLAVSEQGLFVDIARECRALLPSLQRLYFLCGRDAAERFLHWDYGDPEAVARQLEEFELLVAPRHGPCSIPPPYASRVRHLPLSPDYDEDSATEVRRLIAAAQPWEHLVPEAALPLIRRYYLCKSPPQPD